MNTHSIGANGWIIYSYNNFKICCQSKPIFDSEQKVLEDILIIVGFFSEQMLDHIFSSAISIQVSDILDLFNISSNSD